MNLEQFDRFNRLSEKILNDNATATEVKEFDHLFKEWNQSEEFNFVNRLQLHRSLNEKD